MNPWQPAHQLAALAGGMLYVKDVVRQIDGMYLAGEIEMQRRFMECARRFSDVRAPFKDLPGPDPADGRRQQHELVQRERMHADDRNELVNDESR
jgi:hypothetical protein